MITEKDLENIKKPIPTASEIVKTLRKEIYLDEVESTILEIHIQPLIDTIQSLQTIHTDSREQLFPLLHQLGEFAKDAVIAAGPVMTELKVQINVNSKNPEEFLLLNLWASNGKGTPVDRVKELRAALDMANIRIAELEKKLNESIK